MPKKAILIFDPDRRPEQIAYVLARTTILHESGDQVWVSIDDGQAERFAQQGILVQFHPAVDWIETPAILFDPLEGEPQPPASLSAQPPNEESTAYAIVQFIVQPHADWVSQIQELGALFVQTLGSHALIFRLNAAQLVTVRSQPFVRWVGLYHPAYALDFALCGRNQPFTAPGLAQIAYDPALLTGGSGRLALQFFADQPVEAIQAAVTATGVTLHHNDGYYLIVSATPSQLTALLQVAGVYAVERYSDPKLSNQRATRITLTEQVRNLNILTNLTGAGEIVGVFDTGLDNGDPSGTGVPPAGSLHPDLDGRVIWLANIHAPGNSTADAQFDPVTAGNRNDHGTHVVGTIAGNGRRSNGKVRGVAPASQIVFHSVNDPTDTGPNGDGLSFLNFLNAFAIAHARGARVHSNSWGGDSTSNQYTTGNTETIDRFCFLNPEDLVLFAAGNSERDVNPADGTFDQGTVGEESLAKNVICVGASENVANEGRSDPWSNSSLAGITLPVGVPPPPTGRFGLVPGAAVSDGFPRSDNADHLAMFSDRGRVFTAAVGAAPALPTGRAKPDLVAPGTNILSTGPIIPVPNNLLPFGEGNSRRPTSASADFYYVISGTSMATPHVAGAALLVRQFYRQIYGQLRRPVLLERLPFTVDQPTIAAHTSGTVMAWVRRHGLVDQNQIVAARFDSTLARQGNIVQLQANVGNEPAPTLARRHEQTFLLHRGSDHALRISCYDANLAPVNGFGTNGVVTIATESRDEPQRRPTLMIHDDKIVVVWHQRGSNNLVMQRFSVTNGQAVDNAPITLGVANETSTHPFVLHNGTRYAIIWVQEDGNDFKIRLRFVNNDGTAVAAQPRIVFQQAAPIFAPHFVWDGRFDQFLVAWADAREGGAPRSIYTVRVDGNGSAVSEPIPVVTVQSPSVLQRVFIDRHFSTGYLLLWEDNAQRGENLNNPAGQTLRFDVNLAFLDNNGRADGRIPGNRARISDTSRDTYGFACLVDYPLITPIWQSNDELNSDLIGVYALNITEAGRFQAQRDPNTPMIDSGNYTSHQLLEHSNQNMTGVAMTWAGGNCYLLRSAQDHDPLGGIGKLDLLRVNADGLPDSTFGYDGTRRIDFDFGYQRVALHWANQRLLATCSFLNSTKLFLFDLTRNGDPVATFGSNGLRQIAESTTNAITAQVSHRGVGPTFRVLAVWGKRGAGDNHTIRYAVLNEQGNFTVAARNLVTNVAGTATHGWFHFVESETPPYAIAAWQRLVGGNLAVFINRFDGDGRAQAVTPAPAAYVARAPLHLSSALAGDSQNAVIAPRPQVPAPGGSGTSVGALAQWTQRQYGVAWQYRPSAGSPWEIRFSRLSRDGTLLFPAPVPVPAPARDVQVIADASNHATAPQLVWHSDGYGLAWLQQPTAGGKQRLMFTVLDEQGTRLDLNFGVAPLNPAPLFPVSEADADVEDFELVWNGRTFRITWSEKRGTKIYHRQTALAVPRKPGPPGYDRSYEHPSSALIRATLINGATNIRRTALPNQGNDPNDGYGWGRLNLRQSLAPLPPVTSHVRDDATVANGQTLRYRFRLPSDTRLLRATLVWTDPPGAQLVNNLNLQITTPDGRKYVGNRWRAAPNAQYSDPLPTPAPANPFESVHTVEQIVIPGAPTLPSGEYLVDVIGGPFANNAFQTHPGQPFALVFVGSGEEIRFAGFPAATKLPIY